MFRNIIHSSWCIGFPDKLFCLHYSDFDWIILTYKSFEVTMDIVYEKFLNIFHRENQATEIAVTKFSDFFSIPQKWMGSFASMNISITKLKNGKYFISNGKSKGFFLENNSDIEKIPNVSCEYKELQKSLGKITDLFGFTNRYFENIIEIFSNDSESIGLGEFTAEYLNRTKKEKNVETINIDNLFTIAYEANGNRILLDNNNNIYIYGHDLAVHHYQVIDDVPKNTFYKIPNIYTLSEFVVCFFKDFFNLKT